MYCEYGERLVLREVRGAGFCSRFDKLVFFLSTGDLTGTAASVLVLFKRRHNYTLGLSCSGFPFHFLAHSTHDCLASPSASHKHHTVLYQVKLQKSSFTGRLFPHLYCHCICVF